MPPACRSSLRHSTSTRARKPESFTRSKAGDRRARARLSTGLFAATALSLAAPCLRRRRVCWGKAAQALLRHGDWTLEIVKRSNAAKGFVLLPRRWVSERTLAWLNRNRRFAKDVDAAVEPPPLGST